MKKLNYIALILIPLLFSISVVIAQQINVLASGKNSLSLDDQLSSNNTIVENNNIETGYKSDSLMNNDIRDGQYLKSLNNLKNKVRSSITDNNNSTEVLKLQLAMINIEQNDIILQQNKEIIAYMRNNKKF